MPGESAAFTFKPNELLRHSGLMLSSPSERRAWLEFSAFTVTCYINPPIPYAASKRLAAASQEQLVQLAAVYPL